MTCNKKKNIEREPSVFRSQYYILIPTKFAFPTWISASVLHPDSCYYPYFTERLCFN
jgi:hypothetical protein